MCPPIHTTPEPPPPPPFPDFPLLPKQSQSELTHWEGGSHPLPSSGVRRGQLSAEAVGQPGMPRAEALGHHVLLLAPGHPLPAPPLSLETPTPDCCPPGHGKCHLPCLLLRALGLTSRASFSNQRALDRQAGWARPLSACLPPCLLRGRGDRACHAVLTTRWSGQRTLVQPSPPSHGMVLSVLAEALEG